ncbi:MAG TPA: hypothetical protein VJ955_02095, partial [Desulfuromonadales bacterium]|nr:hypothetical protein [Desulfuromonadales bacterium]
MPSQPSIDNLLTSIIGKLDEEVGNLLGDEIHFSPQGSRIATKEDLFAEPRESSVVVHMEVSGEQSAKSFVMLRLQDAILFGSSLIMLPEEQVQQKIEAGRLEGEEANAFGEIANSLASACTHTFRDQSPGNLKFASNKVMGLAPGEVDLTADEPFPPGSYVLCQVSMSFKEETLGHLDFLFPPGLLGLAGEEDGSAAENGSEARRATDRTLFAALQQIQDQISEFLGQELVFSGHANRFTTKKA